MRTPHGETSAADPADVTTKKMFCGICEASCGRIATVEGDRVVSLGPDPQHPSSQGFACSKGAGWTKRCPTGVIGTNRADARETIRALLSEYADGALDGACGTAAQLDALVAQRQPQRIGRAQWQRIDEHEVALGLAAATPRRKLPTVERMLAVSQGLRP